MQFTSSHIPVLSVFLLLQLADVVTTRRALKNGHSEGNPIIAYLMRRLGDNGWVIVKILTGLAGGVVLVLAEADELLWLLCAFYAYIVHSNHRLGR